MGITKVFVLHDRELYGKGLADIFKVAATKDGLSVVGFEGIDAKASNYRSLGTKIRQSGAQLVYFGGTTQSNGGQVAKDLRASGANVKLMVPDGCFEQAFIQAAGAENLNGRAFFTFPGVPPTKLEGAGKIFYDKYKAKFGAEPEAFAIYGYEATSVVLDAIERAGVKDRAKIIEALANTKSFKGALGTWGFDDNGDINVRSLSGNTVANGKFEFVKLLDEVKLQ
jgi:branched-chain amino acid transport system substrate-binding protein